MNFSDASTIQLNGSEIKQLVYNGNVIWPIHEDNRIIVYTTSLSSEIPEITHGSSTYSNEVIDNGDGTYIITIKTDDISDLPTKISFTNKTKVISIDYICDTSKVTTMQFAFWCCYALTSIDLSNFDTSNVKSMSGMFRSCALLTELDLSNFITSNVTNMNSMFCDCTALTSLNLSNFNMNKVASMSSYSGDMFKNCNSLHTLRLDNCNNTTIKRIFDTENFPTDEISGVTRKIYCKRANASGLTPPTNWVFSYID